MRPVWFEFPEAEALYGLEDQVMLGPALLAAPVLQEGAASRAVLLPKQATWFDASTGVHESCVRPPVCMGRRAWMLVVLLWKHQLFQLLGYISLVGSCMCARQQLDHTVLNAGSCTCHAGAPMATDGTPQEVAVTMDASPAYLRGGHIMARRDRARRSTAAMAADPITLVCHPLPITADHS